jgi:hypothetical protein
MLRVRHRSGRRAALAANLESEHSDKSERSDFVSREIAVVLTFCVARDAHGWSVSVKPRDGARVSGFNRRCPWTTLLVIAALAAQTSRSRA